MLMGQRVPAITGVSHPASSTVDATTGASTNRSPKYHRAMRGDPNNTDPRWLTDGLERAGVADGARVVEARFVGYVGTGQTGSNARLGLTWDNPIRPDGSLRPPTVVGKYPSLDFGTRTDAFERGTYFNEFDFYTTLVGTLHVRTPNCYIAHYSDDPFDFALIMEDLAGSQQGDQFEGLTVEQAELAIEQAVGLHAPRWADPLLDSFAPQRARGEDAAEQLGAVYSMLVEPFLARLGPGLDDDVIQLVRDLVPLANTWAAGTGAPLTVVHYDFRPDNFMFGVHPDAAPLTVVDWQTVRQGQGAFDLAYMIGGSFQPAQRAAVERALLRTYLERMAAAGVPYGENQLWHDYRHASLWGVVMTVIATILAAKTERGNRMLTVMGQRHGRHAIELDALSLLRT